MAIVTDNTSQQQLFEKAQAAAEAARHAAEAAQGYADQIGHVGGYADHIGTAGGAVAHAATGGVVDPFIFRLAILALGCFVGYYVVWSVTPALHTPLMSVTNAISSVIVVGALLSVGVDASAYGNDGPIWAKIFGFIALVLASLNIFGGFLVTERILGMNKKKG